MNGLIGWLSLGVLVLGNVLAFVWSAAKVSSDLRHLRRDVASLEETNQEIAADLRDLDGRLRVVESVKGG